MNNVEIMHELPTFLSIYPLLTTLKTAQIQSFRCGQIVVSFYYIYIKYYCSLAKKAGIKQDFTAKQFLSTIGYSIKSQSQIDKISTYNNILKKEGFISITSYKDELGHTRNIYTTNI